MSDHHAQFLIMGNQHSPLELDSKEHMFRDFQEIEKKQQKKKQQKNNKFSARKCGLGIIAAFKSQWCQFILWTISQKSGKMIKFLGTSPKNIKQAEKTIKQTMAN